MSVIEHDDGWYQRMAERTQMRRMLDDAERYANGEGLTVAGGFIVWAGRWYTCGFELGTATGDDMRFELADWWQPDDEP